MTPSHPGRAHTAARVATRPWPHLAPREALRMTAEPSLVTLTWTCHTLRNLQRKAAAEVGQGFGGRAGIYGGVTSHRRAKMAGASKGRAK